MHFSRLWTLAVVTLFAAAVLPTAAAQAAAPTPIKPTCTDSTSTDQDKLSSATVAICKDATGTVLSVVGSVTDLKPGDHKCARVDISQFWGDAEEGEYVFTSDTACGTTTRFDHTGGWVNYDIQVNVLWVAGGSQG